MRNFRFDSAEDFNPKILGSSLCMNFDAVISSFARDPNDRVSGALSSYIYDVPQYPGDQVDGGIYYARYVKLPTSYIPKKQPALLKEFASTVREYVGTGMSFFDLGPGPEWSVKQNTIPSLKALEPSEYFAIDIELEFTTAACKVVSQELPQISVQSAAVDFHFQRLPHPSSATSLVWYPGSTLGNLPSKPGKTFSENQFVTNHLEQLRSIHAPSSSNLSDRRYLVLLMDSRKHDKDSMVNLYTSPEAKGCFLSILHKLKRDLRADSFSPESFEFHSCWNEHSSVVEHQFTALKSQKFSIFDGFTDKEATIEVSKGDCYTLANSIKPSYDDMRDALSRSGWEPLKSSEDAERQFHIHLARSR